MHQMTMREVGSVSVNMHQKILINCLNNCLCKLLSFFFAFPIDYVEQNDESDDDDYLMPDKPAGSFIYCD